MNKRLSQVLRVLLVGIMAMLPACASAAATAASCVYVVGDGRDGNDAKIDKIIYPGQSLTYSSSTQVVKSVPCNSRNFIITDGTTKNANGQIVGDRNTLIYATTSSGVPVQIAAKALWTLNQSRDAMELFYTVCLKYDCFSARDDSGSINYATDGWNGMLGENFGTAMDAAARVAIRADGIDDNIWKLHDPEQYIILQEAMSAEFAGAISANLGFNKDLFCGSGNSNWSDPKNPGQGTFNCSPVRMIVDSVQRGDIQSDESTQGVLAINAQRLQNAQALYGENAGDWLGLQDTILMCKEAGVSCSFNLVQPGASSAPVVINPIQLPQSTPTPEAVP